nr:Lrp/AsnC ligand binding domain-containing protein [Microvirga sp. KLBC 81]
MEAIRQLPQVVECHLMAGDCDFSCGSSRPISTPTGASGSSTSDASKVSVTSRRTFRCRRSSTRGRSRSESVTR